MPKDPQHIRFYWPGAVKTDQAAVASAQDGRTDELPKVVRFEWFNPRPEQKETVPYERILLLWFDEDALYTGDEASRASPLKQYHKFLCRSLATVTSASSVPWTKAAVLGPQLSTTLRAMVVEPAKTRGTFAPLHPTHNPPLRPTHNRPIQPPHNSMSTAPPPTIQLSSPTTSGLSRLAAVRTAALAISSTKRTSGSTA